MCPKLYAWSRGSPRSESQCGIRGDSQEYCICFSPSTSEWDYLHRATLRMFRWINPLEIPPLAMGAILVNKNWSFHYPEFPWSWWLFQGDPISLDPRIHTFMMVDTQLLDLTYCQLLSDNLRETNLNMSSTQMEEKEDPRTQVTAATPPQFWDSTKCQIFILHWFPTCGPDIRYQISWGYLHSNS